jgi:hypothetical protein
MPMYFMVRKVVSKACYGVVEGKKKTFETLLRNLKTLLSRSDWFSSAYIT